MNGPTDKGAGNEFDPGPVVALVSAFVSHNALPQAELPGFIASVHAALRQVAAGAPRPAEEPIAKGPAVPVRKSVTEEFIICLEDGRKFKSLRRHLNAKYGLTPAAYRAKWGLPADYPMVAPGYAAQRSALAKQSGLGVKPKQAPPASKAKRKPAGQAA